MKLLVIKYLTDTISNEELKALQDWVQPPKNWDYFKNAVRANQIMDTSYASINAEKAYQRALGLPKANKNLIRKIYRDLYRHAAVAVMAVATFNNTTYIRYQVEDDKITIT